MRTSKPAPAFYCGPRDVWWRFMAGLNITHQNFLEDTSEWVFGRVQPYQIQRFHQVINHSELLEKLREAIAEYGVQTSLAMFETICLGGSDWDAANAAYERAVAAWNATREALATPPS